MPSMAVRSSRRLSVSLASRRDMTRPAPWGAFYREHGNPFLLFDGS